MNRLFLLFISFITIGSGAHAMEHRSLIKAAYDGNLGLVQQFIDEGQDVNQPSNYGYTALIYAAGNGHLPVVELLITTGAAIDQQNVYGDTAFIWAAINGHLSVVAHLINAGAAINQPNRDGDTALIKAADYGHLSVVECLINAGAAINQRNKWGTTALNFAAVNRHLQSCQALVHAMLKPSLEQKNRIYEFLLCISKNESETIAAAYTLCILDIFKRHLRALIKEENNPRAIAEIEKIRKQEIRNQLLAFCK